MHNAVVRERIPGYKPARHYQGAIAEVISRYLVRAPEALDMPAPSPGGRPQMTSSFLRRFWRSRTSNCPLPYCG